MTAMARLAFWLMINWDTPISLFLSQPFQSQERESLPITCQHLNAAHPIKFLNEKGYHPRVSLASIWLRVYISHTHHTLTTRTTHYHRKSRSTQMHRISNTLHITLYPACFKVLRLVCTSNPPNPSYIYHRLERKSSKFLHSLKY